MAAQTLFGNAFRVTTERGVWQALPNARPALATWHPAALLRMRAPEREPAARQFVEDLASVADRLTRSRADRGGSRRGMGETTSRDR